MLKKLKHRILAFENRQHQIIAQNKELEWAHIFHDAIRGKPYLENLAIYPGRWAGGYALLYVLIRILSDYKPKSIIEFGLGESSKIISTLIQHELPDTHHLILEQSQEWIDSFNSRYTLSDKSTILHLPVETKEVKGFKVNSYIDIEKKVNKTFDLYLIDGPIGSDRYSRYDICRLANLLKKEDEFIIFIDDTNRYGEQDTLMELSSILQSKEIKFYRADYCGTKNQTIVASEKYKYTLSL
jgi:hypothetical protein